ncbi:gramicidin S synthetase 1, partial [Metarhizium brunneum ARSEF 3297]
MQLIQRGLGHEEPIGIWVTHGSHQVIAQLAIIYMGGTCVPLDPDRPRPDTQTQLQVAGVKNMVVDDAFQHRHLPVTKIPLLQSPDGGHTAGNAATLPVETKADFRSHILFTSGTTGTPKAVEILARGIVRLARDPVYGPRSSDTVGHLGNPCFDLSLMDIWASLLNGSTIAALDRREALLPKSLDRMLKENHVTYLFMPTAIFHIVAPDEGNVFLTGATGFVGAHLLVNLLQCPQVRSVCCLVRSDSHASARKKMGRNLEKYHLQHLATEFESKIKILLGDFSKPRLGLSEPAFLALAESTSVVFHLGAQINYNEPYLANRAANMTGVLNMIQLAVASRPKALHYASSMAAFGPTGLVADKVGELTEDAPLQPYLDTTVAYETGYGQSQWVSDEMLCQLMKRGFPAAVYRMGAVVCNSKDGVGNPDDFLSRLTADCFRLGIYPHLPDQRKEMIPVDYVAPAMRMMVMSNRNLGKVYHLTPGVRENISVNEYFRIAQQHTGIALSALAYGDWVHALLQADKSGVELGLKPLFPMLMERVKNGRTRW